MLKLFKIVFLFFYINLIFSTNIFSQNPLEIKNISTHMGLSSPRILSIYQDFKGFIWIGTEYGLNCFDGYEFKIFRPIPSEGQVLKGNAIYSIFENNRKELIVGTEKGVCIYNRKTGKFYEISLKDNSGNEIHNKIVSIIQDNDKSYWLGLQHMGILHCDSTFKKFKLYKYEHQENWERINNILLFNKKILVATDNNGVLLFNPLTEKFYNFFKPENLMKNHDNYVSYIYKDSKQNLWFLLRKGAYKLNYPYLNNKDIMNLFFKNSELTDVKEDKYGNLWFASKDSGIYKLYPDGKIINYCNKNNIITTNYIVKIFFDKDNNMWLGTFDKGIDFSPFIKKPIQYIGQTSNNNLTLSKPSVLSVCEDDDGNLWIGTDGGGLNFYDRKKNKIEVFKNNPYDKNSICGNNIVFVFKDSKGNIWASAYLKGLSKFNKNKRNFVNYSLIQPPNYINIFNNDIRFIYEDKDGLFWIATNGGGVFYFDPHNGKIIKNLTAPYSNNDSLLISNYCLGILSDKNDSLLFIFSYNGLSIYNRYTSKFTNYWENKNTENNISSSEIYTMFLKDNNFLYLGTSSGLNIFNMSTGIFSSYIQNRHLPRDIINTIIPDLKNKLWMSSYDYIIYFEPFTMYKKEYKISDIVPIEQFNPGSGCRTSAGEIIFGGTNGLIIFHPDSFKKNTKPPEVVFTNFKIFNKTIFPDSINSPLKENIEIAKEIKLNYSNTMISITFAALNYIYPEYNQYAFKLENFDKQWNYCGNNRTAVYTNLPPGKYIFKVIASNNDGIWNFKGASINITVLPPFYMTWWFKILVLLTIILIPFALYSYRLHLLKIKNKELEEKISERTKEIKEKNEELLKQTIKLNRINKLLKIKQDYIKEQSKILKLQKEQLEEANNSKDKLFSIIAHDLKNPFSSIIGLTQVLEEDYDELSEDDRKLFLKNIRIATQNIFYLLDNLLYWSRAQLKKIIPNFTKFCLNDLIDENINLFDLSAQDKSINIEFEYPQQKVIINSDRQLLNSIIRNLLSNAIKFTPQNGHIKIVLKDYDNNIKMSIKDSGKGLSKEEINKLLFGNHYYKSSFGTNNEIGSGLGLAICKEFIKILKGELNAYPNEDKGVTFYIILPKNNSVNNYPINEKNL